MCDDCREHHPELYNPDGTKKQEQPKEGEQKEE